MTTRGAGSRVRAHRPDAYPAGAAGLHSRPAPGRNGAASGGRRGLRRWTRPGGLAGALLLGLLAASPSAAQAPPPDGEWRSIETAHFRVTFPAGLETLGRETAARAERAYVRLSGSFVDPPDGRTEILLTDHVDVSNGSARVAPYRVVTVFARPPVDGFALSHFDDWLEVVLVHELAHVFHLDVTGGLGDALRSVFGRVPAPWPFFPQLGTPRWTIEGLATWYESALTESGRVRGTYHDMVVRTAVLEGRFEDIDEASGNSPVWPGGQRPYIYGSLFFEHLTERYGADRMAAFVEAVAGQIVPYRLNAAAREAFGVSFSEAWRAWREEVAGRTSALEVELSARQPITVTEPVTRGARFALYPRVAPDGETLVYARADGRSDTQLRKGTASGSASEELTRTNGTAAFDFTPEGRIVLAQLELDDPYRMYADLWLADLDGTTWRLTEGDRLDHPSVTPDGREVVAIRNVGGTTQLVAVDLATREVREITPARPDVHWGFPAVSPDGRWIAAARWSPGAYFDVVVLDRATGGVEAVTVDRAMDTAPAWSPDGRWLLWASDRSGIPNVLAAPFDPATGRPGRVVQVTNLLTGAHFPSVSPDGRWLHFSAYHVDGWEIERVAFDPATFFPPFPLDPRFASSEPVPAVAEVSPDTVARARGYDPLRTLAPRYWSPAYRSGVSSRGVEVIEPSYGVLTTAEDLVGRHALGLELLVSTSDARVSGDFGYTYRGLGNPLLSLSVRQGWDAFGPFAQEVDGDSVRFFLDEREREATASATFRRVRFRNALSLTLGGGMVWEDRSALDEDRTESDLRLRRSAFRLTDLRATVGFSNARGHAFSVSREEGLSAFLTGRTRSELDVPEASRGVLGADRSVDEVFGQVRLYEGFDGPGFADHVLALRTSAGLARGPGADEFHYDVGGVSGEREPLTGFSLFGGGSRFFPVRGYRSGDRSGRNAWSASAEYRFPLALVNEGLGLVPVHLDRVSGLLFVDGGNAWGPGEGIVLENFRAEPLVSTGAELVVDFLTFFSIPLSLRGGVAVRLSEEKGAVGYVRLGRPF